MDESEGALARLVARLALLMREATEETEALAAEPDEVEAWQRAMEEALMRYHQAAYMVGTGSETISPAARAAIVADVQAQLRFLDNFSLTIQEAAEWAEGWAARAASYAAAIKVPYWRGRTKMLPLPAMPAEGTQCLNNCKCAWEVVTVDEGAGDYDAYWRRGADDSCQTCRQRESSWRPVRIRGGRLQTG